MDYNRDNFKLSIDKDRTQFFVNEKKGIVSCVVTANIVSPYNWECPVTIYDKHIEGLGIARCHGDDNFDAERGKRIALAKAENKAYLNAINYLNSQRKHLSRFMNMIDEFTEKAYRHCNHNDDYMESIHNVNHPMYKVTVTDIKHGYTNGKPNFKTESAVD